MAMNGLRSLIHPWFNCLMQRPTDDEAQAAPISDPSDWSRHGVTGELSDESSAPPVDESLVIRFLMGRATESESVSVRDCVRRFSKWRAYVEQEEKYEREAFQDRNAAWDRRDFATFVADYRRDLYNGLCGQSDRLLCAMLRGMTPEDCLGGPPVDEVLLRRVISGDTARSEEVVRVSGNILTFQAWHERYDQMRRKPEPL